MRAAGRVTAAAVAVVVVQTLPVTAYADSSSPTGAIGAVTTQVAGQIAAPVSTCKLDTHELFAQPLTATVTTTASGVVDFTWHAFASAKASSPDPCVTAVMVTTQLTDTAEMPDCPPVEQSPTVAATSNDPYTYASTGNTDFEVDNPVDFKVAYFGGPTAAQPVEDAAANRLDGSAASSVGSSSLARCYRLRSTVTESDTAYYANNLGQFVPYCSEQVSTEFVSTPAGPKQVGDPIVESVTC
ncbi:MAG: hypothetical protein QOD07_28 [Frankiaceae bacterium]|jgi:hypothetical protein|nr:hypothetical protein [Frankiaceae bacterium]